MVICKRCTSSITMINRFENSGSKKLFEHDHEPTTDHNEGLRRPWSKSDKMSVPDLNQVQKVKVDHDYTNQAVRM